MIAQMNTIRSRLCDNYEEMGEFETKSVLQFIMYLERCVYIGLPNGTYVTASTGKQVEPDTLC